MITDLRHLSRINTGDGGGTRDWGNWGKQEMTLETKQTRTKKPEYKTKAEKHKNTQGSWHNTPDSDEMDLFKRLLSSAQAC